MVTKRSDKNTSQDFYQEAITVSKRLHKKSPPEKIKTKRNIRIWLRWTEALGVGRIQENQKKTNGTSKAYQRNTKGKSKVERNSKENQKKIKGKPKEFQRQIKDKSKETEYHRRKNQRNITGNKQETIMVTKRSHKNTPQDFYQEAITVSKRLHKNSPSRKN